MAVCVEISSLLLPIVLCPLCAAKYQEFIKRDEDAWHGFTEAFSEGDDSDVPIFLGDENTSVRFTEAHMHDLITILNSD